MLFRSEPILEEVELLSALVRDLAEQVATLSQRIERPASAGASSGMAAAAPSSSAALPSAEREALKARVRARLPADAQGRVTATARANAVKGRVPR